jgi:hypothetical protein
MITYLVEMLRYQTIKLSAKTCPKARGPLAPMLPDAYCVIVVLKKGMVGLV